MTDDAPPTPEKDSTLTRSERLFLRISIWQTVLSVAAVFTGLIALYAALTESEAVRRQTAASVWPYVQLAVDDYSTQEASEFALSVSNVGVGPAHVRGMRVSIGGQARATWRDVLQSVGRRDVAFSQAFVTNRVLSPSESVRIFGVEDPEAVRALQAAVADPESAIEFCYCSIFEQCWIADSRTPNASREPVRACPDYGAEELQN